MILGQFAFSFMQVLKKYRFWCIFQAFYVSSQRILIIYSARDSSSYGHGAAAWCYGLYLLSKLHLLLVLLQMFDLFDVKCNGVIEFGEFVQSLGVFHPNAPVEEKIYCKVNISLDCNACRCTCTRPPSHTQTSSFFCISIWFLLVG